jgi:hypothetical protein
MKGFFYIGVIEPQYTILDTLNSSTPDIRIQEGSGLNEKSGNDTTLLHTNYFCLNNFGQGHLDVNFDSQYRQQFV